MNSQKSEKWNIFYFKEINLLTESDDELLFKSIDRKKFFFELHDNEAIELKDFSNIFNESKFVVSPYSFYVGEYENFTLLNFSQCYPEFKFKMNTFSIIKNALFKIFFSTLLLLSVILLTWTTCKYFDSYNNLYYETNQGLVLKKSDKCENNILLTSQNFKKLDRYNKPIKCKNKIIKKVNYGYEVEISVFNIFKDFSKSIFYKNQK